VAEPIRVAMWSGPRNISTAMMYAFANRSDCYASDEPLYAHYLTATGVAHPGANEVIAHGETDWRTVVAQLQAEVPDGSVVWYQKHMCHHIIEGVDLHWVGSMQHCFLIRDPREVLLSLSKKTDAVDAWATGLPQQARIIDAVRQITGTQPLIVDSRDILLDPARMLGQICEALGIGFDDAMLAWEAGPRSCDGIWAKHWYDAVWKSTGFAPYRPRLGELPAELAGVLEEVQPIYAALAAERIR
jgi:hypothetical protein